MTNSLASIERFLTNLAAAYGWMPKRETVQFWSEKLSRFDLTEDQWSRALSRIVSNQESRPSLAEIFPYLRAQCFKQGAELVPVFETFRDAAGRSHAAKTGRYTSSVPGYDQLRVWEAEKATVEEAREAFARGFREGGGTDQKLRDEYFEAIVKAPEPSRKPQWYEEKDEVPA